MLFGQTKPGYEELGSENSLECVEEISKNEKGNKECGECIIWSVLLDVDRTASEVDERESFADTEYNEDSVLVGGKSLSLISCLEDLGEQKGSVDEEDVGPNDF
jgi:hypothetical protein